MVLPSPLILPTNIQLSSKSVYYFILALNMLGHLALKMSLFHNLAEEEKEKFNFLKISIFIFHIHRFTTPNMILFV